MKQPLIHSGVETMDWMSLLPGYESVLHSPTPSSLMIPYDTQNGMFLPSEVMDLIVKEYLSDFWTTNVKKYAASQGLDEDWKTGWRKREG